MTHKANTEIGNERKRSITYGCHPFVRKRMTIIGEKLVINPLTLPSPVISNLYKNGRERS